MKKKLEESNNYIYSIFTTVEGEDYYCDYSVDEKCIRYNHNFENTKFEVNGIKIKIDQNKKILTILTNEKNIQVDLDKIINALDLNNLNEQLLNSSDTN